MALYSILVSRSSTKLPRLPPEKEITDSHSNEHSRGMADEAGPLNQSVDVFLTLGAKLFFNCSFLGNWRTVPSYDFIRAAATSI